MTGPRYDLQPEPERGRDQWTLVDGRGGQILRVVNLPVPAAGHLGVQEVGCPTRHDRDSIEAGQACPSCHAVV